MRAHEFLSERADVRTEIENLATVLPGDINDYFVRFTDQDKIGYSARQHFGRTPDIDDPRYDADALPSKTGRPALWFYPLRTYLKNPSLYASDKPYVWLVRLRPNAFLQAATDKSVEQRPGWTRAGIMKREGGLPMAVFFRPEFDVVDRWHRPQQVSERVNPQTISPGFHDERQLPNGMTMVADANDQGTGLIIKMFDGDDRKNDIAFTRFLARKNGRDEPSLQASFVYVNEKYRRQGLAKAMYQYAQELGNDILPSDSQTDAGRAMWQGFKGAVA